MPHQLLAMASHGLCMAVKVAALSAAPDGGEGRRRLASLHCLLHLTSDLHSMATTSGAPQLQQDFTVEQDTVQRAHRACKLLETSADHRDSQDAKAGCLAACSELWARPWAVLLPLPRTSGAALVACLWSHR